MVTTTTTTAATTASARTATWRRSRWWEFVRTQRLATVALVIIVLFVVAAIFAPLLAPYGATEQIRTAIRHAPDGRYWFGTDDLGRDIYSRVLYGARTSILISVTTVVVSGAIGTAIGVLSGYFGGRWLDSLLQRIMDAIIAVPGLVLLLFLAAVLGPSIRNTIIALIILIVPAFSRLARGEMLRVREEPYVEAARANGCGTVRILVRHGLPNLFAPPGHAAFYRELATSPRYRSLVHLSRLDVGTTWAALNLGLTFRDCYFHILASYDDGETSRFGPGAAHLRELLRYAIERGLARFDFTIGDEPYKRDWCENEQRLFDHSAAATLRGLPAAALAFGWGRAKRAIKKSAPLWTAVQRLRAAAGSLRKPAKSEKPEE